MGVRGRDQRVAWSAGCLLLLACACGRRAIDPGDAGSIDGPLPLDVAVEADLAIAVPPGTCNGPGGPAHASQNERAIDLLQGTWRLCVGEAPVGSPADQGLLVEGKAWFSLILDGEGALVPRNGFDGGGTIESPNPRQVNFQLSDGASYITLPSFTDNPRRVRMGGSLDAVYERLP